MELASRGENDLFKLALFLIVVAFFIGFSTDAKTVLAGVANIFELAQGRNPATGQFANYPSGAVQAA